MPYTPSKEALTTSTKRPYIRTERPIPPCHKEGLAKSFLIVFMSRSGSTAISSELQHHSQTHMKILEHLDRLNISASDSYGALSETRKFFDEGIQKGLTPGFKIRPYHILSDVEGWKKLIQEYGTRLIWQYRKNIFKSCLGSYARYYRGDLTAVSGINLKEDITKRCEMGLGCRFKIDNMTGYHALLKASVKNQDKITEAVKALDSEGQCTMEVPYEDYLYHPGDTIKDLQTFLGLKRERHAPSRMKATSDSLCDVVENFDELCHNFYGCSLWQPLLEDDVNDCHCTKFSNGPMTFCQTM